MYVLGWEEGGGINSPYSISSQKLDNLAITTSGIWEEEGGGSCKKGREKGEGYRCIYHSLIQNKIIIDFNTVGWNLNTIIFINSKYITPYV